MSLEHIEDMLKTLIQYNHSEITLIFHSKHDEPLLSICYLNDCFHLTLIIQRNIETYDDIESTLEAIKLNMQNNFQEP